MAKRKIPMRKCTGCMEMRNKKELIRVVKTPENEIIIDLTGKKNGRGAYICPRIECFNLAIKNKGLDRSFKMKIPTEVYDQLKEEVSHLDAE